MPYSIGTPLTIDMLFGLYWSAIKAAKERSAATGDVVVIRDLSGRVVALVLSGVVYVPEEPPSS